MLHDDEEIPARASFGAATLVASDASVRDLIRRADLEMYAARPGGSPALSR